MSDEPQNDFITAYTAIVAEVDKLGRALQSNPNDQVVRARLNELVKELGRLKEQSRDRAAHGLGFAREGLMEIVARGLSKRGPEEQVTVVVTLSDSITPGALGEILMAFDTLHRELTGAALVGLVAKIGSPEEIVARSGSFRG